MREASGVNATTGSRYTWFVFCIRCVVGQSRSARKGQVPDIENIPKLIVDAFTGILYPDDNLNYVRGIQVEAAWGPDANGHAEVWIPGQPK
jgi:Holliday junction resolvase RusA-like endonuclease